MHNLPLISLSPLPVTSVLYGDSFEIRIQNCIATISCEDAPQNESVRGEPVSTDQLRILGNEAYKVNRMEDAIRYYSEAITASPKETIDHRLLSNRSLLYLTKKDYANALVDAEKCIEINPCFWKGYYRKADAIANLIILSYKFVINNRIIYFHFILQETILI
jgi:tetratricopeptide (TPR) repeat protein